MLLPSWFLANACIFGWVWMVGHVIDWFVGVHFTMKDYEKEPGMSDEAKLMFS
jgi:hypothetical protein